MVRLYHRGPFQGRAVKREYNKKSRKEEVILSSSDIHLKRLLEYINTERGIDFSHYRYATVVRKLALRLQESACRDYEEYLAFLKGHPEEMQPLVRTLTIKVSNFFRNPLVFELLNTTVIPELVDEFGFLKVWSIGCAHGEEPYSIAILVHELLTQENLSFSYNIQGTDVDPDAIERARTGEYAEGELVETKRRFIDTYFTKSVAPPASGYGSEHYSLNSEIRSMVLFSSSNIIDQLLYKRAYMGNYNLVLCRNVLIYMNIAMQERIFRALEDILYEDGYLVLGASETMPESVRSGFEQPVPDVRIFRKRRSSTAL
jgi:chemotaxis methyl-accepting protein methylase